jgi:osmotically-inducible protein OsmY
MRIDEACLPRVTAPRVRALGPGGRAGGISPREVSAAIQSALVRVAELAAAQIEVEVRGDTVILRGRARSWIERRDARRAAWAVAGVTKVEDRIAVGDDGTE